MANYMLKELIISVNYVVLSIIGDSIDQYLLNQGTSARHLHKAPQTRFLCSFSSPSPKEEKVGVVFFFFWRMEEKKQGPQK